MLSRSELISYSFQTLGLAVEKFPARGPVFALDGTAIVGLTSCPHKEGRTTRWWTALRRSSKQALAGARELNRQAYLAFGALGAAEFLIPYFAIAEMDLQESQDGAFEHILIEHDNGRWSLLGRNGARLDLRCFLLK